MIMMIVMIITITMMIILPSMMMIFNTIMMIDWWWWLIGHDYDHDHDGISWNFCVPAVNFAPLVGKFLPENGVPELKKTKHLLISFIPGIYPDEVSY